MNTERLYTWIGDHSWAYDAIASLAGYRKSVEQFVAILAEHANGSIRRILDAGCGTGQYSRAALLQFPSAEVVAFDLQRSMVEASHAKLQRDNLLDRATLFAADITGPLGELDGEQFDAIITGGVLEHVPIEEVVQNLSRFLTPGGTSLIHQLGIRFLEN